jgi:prophage regulatory protein
MHTEPLLRLPDVCRLTALSKTSVYDAIKAGRFPAPLRVARRAVRWRSVDVADWLAGLETTDHPCLGWR